MKLFSSLDFAKIKPDEQSLIGVGLLFKMIPDYTAHYICLKNDFFFVYFGSLGLACGDFLYFCSEAISRVAYG
jgi:hypothetical protein